MKGSMMNEETSQPKTNESRDTPAAAPIERRGVFYSKPLSTWYKWMLIFCALLPLTLFGGPLFLLAGAAFLVFLLALLTKAGSFSKDEVLDRAGFKTPSIVTPLLLGGGAIISIMALYPAINNFLFFLDDYISEHIVDGMQAYEGSHQNLPDADRWCDLLKDDPETSKVFPFDSDMPFAMNEHLSEMEGDIPADMVVLFETMPGWNLTGGPELAKSRLGRKHLRIVTGDWNRKQVHIRDVPYLRWRLEDSGVIPVVDLTARYWLFSSLVGIASATILVICRKQLRKYFILALVVLLLSGGMGLLFGFISEEPLYTVLENKHLGHLFGGAAGLLAGVCFVPVLGRVAERLRPEVSLVGWGTMTGAIVGILCSCVVHGFLMIAYRETSPVNMLVGTVFGAWAGTMLGWITAGLMGRRRRKTTLAEPLETSEPTHASA